MFHTLKNVFGKKKKSMVEISKQFEVEEKTFKNVDSLGLFADNHDMPRFLSHSPGEIEAFRSALVFTLTARGIPFFYYGSEHAYAGGQDPRNRESMFADLKNTDSVIYQMVKKVNKLRKSHKLYDASLVELKVLPNLYVYSKGQVLVALTNTENDLVAEVRDVPFAVGDVVCNLFNS